ncbi:MAG: tetratricopeptide repeat protein [Candidatus Wallbacteria bacterium]
MHYQNLKKYNLVLFLSVIFIFILFSLIFKTSKFTYAQNTFRQPIIEDQAESAEKYNYLKYENSDYGFEISYHKSLIKSKTSGGIIGFTPADSENYRFVPSLVISRYFVLRQQNINEIINLIEKNYSGLPDYKLISITSAGPKNAIAVREFSDTSSLENVYEVAVYKKSGNELFEAVYQIPKSFADSDLSKHMMRSAEKLKITIPERPDENPDNPQAPGPLAENKIQAAQSTESVNIKNPESMTPAEILINAKTLINRERFLEAIGLLKKITANSKSSIEANVLIGKCYIGLKDYKRASAAYKQIASANPANLEFKNMFVDSLIIAKDYKNALNECKKALELKGSQKDMAMAYLNLGNIFLGMKRYNEAMNSYLAGIEKIPANIQLRNNAAITALKLGDVAGAKEHYNEALRMDKNYKNAHLALARIYFNEQSYTAASYHYNQLLAIDPDFKEAYVNLYMIYIKTQMEPKADELLNNLKNNKINLYNEVMVDLSDKK